MGAPQEKILGWEGAASARQGRSSAVGAGITQLIIRSLLSHQDLMTQNGISYVLNASNSCPKPDFICDSHFMRIPVNDNYCEKLLPWLDKSIEFIGELLF